MLETTILVATLTTLPLAAMALPNVGDMLGTTPQDVTEIARLRDVADGTVRAQLTCIYAKAGVSGRAQFAACFVEDLLDHALIQPNMKAG